MRRMETAGGVVAAGFGSRLFTPIRVLLATTLVSSSIVMFQPAPCDLLFALLLPLSLWYGYSLAPRRLPYTLYLALYLFIFANLISLLLADHIIEGIAFFGTTLYMLISFLLLADIVGRHGKAAVDLMFTALVIAALIAATIGILARFHWIPHPEMFYRDEFGQRVQSTFKDPNVFAPFLVAATLVMLAKVLETRRTTSRHIVALGLLLGGILFAFSRGAYIHLLISLAVFTSIHLLVIRERQVVNRLFINGSVLLLIGLPALIWLLIASGLVDFFFHRLSLQSYDQDRFGTQSIALAIAMDRPLGIGPGQFTGERFGHAVHSLYLRVLVENGLLGLLGLLLFLGSWIFLCVTHIFHRGPYRGVYLACLSVMIGMLVESAIIDTLHWRHAFLLLAIPVGLAMYEEK